MNTPSSDSKPPSWYRSTQGRIALLATTTITLSLLLRLTPWADKADYPLFLCYLLGALPLVYELIRKALRREFGSDLLAGISIITSVLLGEHLAGAFVVLMLSGGEALEAYALRRASSVLDALSKRMPHDAFRRRDKSLQKISLSEVQISDVLEVRPHDTCPVDGVVIEGHGSMDESYLTGEPYQISKVVGSNVMSGAINGESLMVIKATALPIDSRYQKIAQVIEAQASRQVPIKRLGDMLGAWYTPLALAIAIASWLFSGDPRRFLAVLVVATPCPLLIAIPVALIGAIGSAASRGIIIKNPAALEVLSKCRTMILDKTGTLTYGKPILTEIEVNADQSEEEALALVASLETYSKHPLALAVIEAAKERKITLRPVNSISEKPGEGLKGVCDSRNLTVTGRSKVASKLKLPDYQGGLECIVLEDDKFFALLRFRDAPRKESKAFVEHLNLSHSIKKVKILSGDRIEEVEHLAKLVGISDVLGGLSPEEKLIHIEKEKAQHPVVYVGDGINDAPALQAATVGIAVGTNSDITSESADVVLMDPSLTKVDELLHLSARFRSIALQSAVGGMGLSCVGMGLAAFGLITPLVGAITQEAIDVLAVGNALRMAFQPNKIRDDL